MPHARPHSTRLGTTPAPLEVRGDYFDIIITTPPSPAKVYKTWMIALGIILPVLLCAAGVGNSHLW